jgi:acyl dehydratase
MGLYFEDFVVGAVYRHQFTRTVAEYDNVLFTSLTMNFQPLHLDEEFSKGTVHGQRIVNSLFTLGLIVSFQVPDLTLGTTLGNLGYEEVRFPHPVFHGDTLHAQSTVLAKRSSRSRPDAGVVTLLHEGFNQKDELICSCRRFALMAVRPVGS